MQENKFFQLLRYSIGVTDELEPMTEEEWQEMYDLAKKQSLVGIVFLGVSRLPVELQPPKKVKLNWYLQAERIAKRNTEVNRLAVAISEKFASIGLPNCILKGQGNALMYPVPSSRISGDIDIWLNGDVQRIIEMARRKDPKTKACYHHVDFGYVQGTEIELHYRPSFLNSLVHNARMQKWFELQAEEQCKHMVELPNGVGRIPVPTAAFNRIFQMAHISNHVIHEGIGLRQLLDYYYVLKQGFSEEERLHDECLMRQMGLYHVAGAVMYVLQEVFGLEQKLMIVPVDEKRGRFLLQEILLSGNFGQYDKRLENSHSAWAKNTQRLRRDIRFLKYFPSECLWEPIFRWYHFFWRWRHR